MKRGRSDAFGDKEGYLSLKRKNGFTESIQIPDEYNPTLHISRNDSFELSNLTITASADDQIGIDRFAQQDFEIFSRVSLEHIIQLSQTIEDSSMQERYSYIRNLFTSPLNHDGEIHTSIEETFHTTSHPSHREFTFFQEINNFVFIFQATDITDYQSLIIEEYLTNVISELDQDNINRIFHSAGGNYLIGRLVLQIPDLETYEDIAGNLD